MELKRGQPVTSKAGRDVTRAYVVLEVQGCARDGRQRALVADGGKWTIDAPKRKNPRHLQAAGAPLAECEMCSDATIKAAIAGFNARRGAQQQGG